MYNIRMPPDDGVIKRPSQSVCAPREGDVRKKQDGDCDVMAYVQTNSPASANFRSSDLCATQTTN